MVIPAWLVGQAIFSGDCALIFDCRQNLGFHVMLADWGHFQIGNEAHLRVGFWAHFKFQISKITLKRQRHPVFLSLYQETNYNVGGMAAECV